MKIVLDSHGQIKSRDVAPTLTTCGNLLLGEVYSIADKSQVGGASYSNDSSREVLIEKNMSGGCE